MTSYVASPYPKLLSPITINKAKIRNRSVITSHGASEAFRLSGESESTYIEYMRRRAAGGAGLIIVQPPFFAPYVAHSAESIRRHSELAAAIKAEGAVALLQLAHLGAFGRSDSDVHRPPLWDFSGMQSAAGETAHIMTDDEIEDMILAFRQTASLAAEAGFDGVEVHGGHGYLIQQSYTPSFNQRKDRWGQDRSLFARRILEAARDEVGDDGIVCYRTTVDDLRPQEDGGLGLPGVVEILSRLLETGTIDLLNTTIGDGNASYARAIPDYRYEDAPNLPALSKLREAIDIRVPVIAVGKILSASIAESALEKGICDLVALTRAHIADPDFMEKARAGTAHTIRPCVGANVCVNRKLDRFPEISCFHNPEVLREKELALTSTSRPRRILVVGAGPAGLKAAEVAAKRGHLVSVVDADDHPGGRLRYAGLTRGSTMVASIDYLMSELSLLRVKVQRATVDEEMLNSEAPDEVILATGGRPRIAKPFDGSEGVRPLDSIDALQGRTGHSVLVYDAVGANEASLVAEALALQGKRVTFVTPFEIAAPFAGSLHRVQLPEILYPRLERLITNAQIGWASDGTAVVVDPRGETLAEIPFNSIVRIGPLLPNLDLVPALRRMSVPYRLIGDALAPRHATQAFKEGHEAGCLV
jgi:2,4-dienoyl-CoA reductase-like NADH-dependent reductase (Old Yellow Enzyme family)